MGGFNTNLRERRQSRAAETFMQNSRLMNSIYNNTSYTTTQNEEMITQTIVEREKIKKTKSYTCPIMVQKGSLKLDKEAMEKDKYYISFTYTSTLTFSCIIYQHGHKTEDNSLVSLNSKTMLVDNMDPGVDVIFFNKDVFITSEDMSDIKGSYNLVIEFIAYKTYPKEIECHLATFCSIARDQRIIPHHQELTKGKSCFKLYDVYCSEGEQSECGVCYSGRKNTIFLPCKHSYMCKECFGMIRAKNKCPLCRQTITDTLIMNDIKK